MSDEPKKKKKKKKGLMKSESLDLKPKKKKKSSEEQETGLKKKKPKDYGRDVSGTLEGDGKKKKKKDLAEKPAEPVRELLPVEQDDYIIVKVGKKNELAFAHSPKRNTAYIERTMNTDAPVTFEYDGNTLIANLGKDPLPGKVHGVDIQPHYGTIDTPMGPMHMYRKLNDAEKDAIRIAQKKIVKKFESLGLEKLFPFTSLEVHNPRGRWAGMYQVSFKSGEAVDKVKLFAKILDDQIYNQYVFAHECGHGIWYRYVPERIRALWLEQYNAMTAVTKAKKSELADQCQSLIASSLSIRDFQRDLEGDELAMFKEALGYLKKVHKMSPEDVNVLLNQNSKVLAEIWPTSASISNADSLAALHGPYAAVSVQEMFAEIFAAHIKGDHVGKTLTKLLEKTLKVARSE
uniref:Metallopeptidase n=1 Tax=Pseudomonas phage HRDY3 TaxID=3236930 RepID=A0AB39CE77_9VIRU